MPETSFVDSLVIADDERLRSLRPDRLVGVDTEERRRGTGTGIGGIAPPEAIDGKLRAAVNAGAIVSFVAGIGADDKAGGPGRSHENRGRADMPSPHLLGLEGLHLDCARSFTSRIQAKLMRGAKRRMLATTSRAPRRLGTDGSQTHRWREVDSNFRFRAAGLR